jgi:hypothetical protein
MTITAIGWIVIPVTLILFLFRPSLLLPLTLMLAVFQGASVINFPGDSPVAVLPYFFAASFVALHSMLIGEPRYALARWKEYRAYLAPVLLFATFAGASALVLPLTNDRLLIDSWRGTGSIANMIGRMEPGQVPLHWTLGNLAQTIYLGLNVSVVWTIVMRALRPGQLRLFVNIFYWSGLVVILVGMYQELAFKLGYHFPSEFFNSNISGMQLYGVVLGQLGIERMSATFSESSYAGAFLAAWLTLSIFSFQRGRSLFRFVAAFAAGSFALIMTLSSTGYIAFGGVLVFLMIQPLITLVFSGRISVQQLGFVAIIIAALVAGALVVPDPRAILNLTLMDKAASMSAFYRIRADLHALELFRDSFGVGVGLGSDKASSLATYVLANLGIVGTLLFVFMLLSALGISDQNPGEGEMVRNVKAMRGAFMANLLAMLVAIGDPNWPIFWVLLGLLVGTRRACNSDRDELSHRQESLAG